jgi:pentatricopeptide repeat protein
MTTLMQSERILGKTKDRFQTVLAQSYLTRNRPLSNLHHRFPNATVTTSSPDSNCFKEQLRIQRESFRAQTNLTQDASMHYLEHCLSYFADLCAKHGTPQLGVIAWYKLRESGILPRERTLNTYLYLFALGKQHQQPQNHHPDNSQTTTTEDVFADPMHARIVDACLDVISFRDQFFPPTENTVLVKIKLLMAEGNAVSAEQVLNSLSSKHDTPGNNDDHPKSSSTSWKRLRTFAPILKYYCDTGNMNSAFRLFRQMRETKGVYLDADTYILLMGAAARVGLFHPTATSPTTKDDDLGQYGFFHSGPALFDELATEMAQDVMELHEEQAMQLLHHFETSFQDNHNSSNKTKKSLIAKRVSVNETTAVCNETGATLRLFNLTVSQRQNVQRKLLKMANRQRQEYGEKLLAEKRSSGKNVSRANGVFKQKYVSAVSELSKFTKWMKYRNGTVFTAIIDGPNVAYYGHNYVCYKQVKEMVDTLEAMGETPLVIMPQKYVSSQFFLTSTNLQKLTETDQQIMKNLVDQKKVFVVPSACLDDFYWMMASVADQGNNETLFVPTECNSGRFPGLRPILVTNDQMRDHRHAMLKARYFRRWASCHIVNYEIKSSTSDDDKKEEYDESPSSPPLEIKLFPADFFSREIQGNKAEQFGNSMAWHFPVAEWPKHDRLCISILQ